MREEIIEVIHQGLSPVCELADDLIATVNKSSIPQRYKSEAFTTIKAWQNMATKDHLEQAILTMMQLIDELQIDGILHQDREQDRTVEIVPHDDIETFVSESNRIDGSHDHPSTAKVGTARWKSGGQVKNRNLQSFLRRAGYKQNSGGNGELIFTRRSGVAIHKISIPNHPSDDVAYGTLAKILSRLESQLEAQLHVLRGDIVMTTCSQK